MKASRSEQVLNTLGKYLKRRQYTDGELYKKSELQLHQTLEDMSVNGALQIAGSSTNVISFSSISGDATAIDQQFSRLKTFISEASEPFKSELTHLLFPMFVQLYLELISNGQKAAAQKFHSRHTSLFLESEDYTSVVESLSRILTLSDIDEQPEIKKFRENKYLVKLTDDCYEYLSRFLKNMDHTTLLQLLNLCIDIEVQLGDQPTKKLNFDYSFNPSTGQSPKKEIEGQNEKIENLKALTALKEVIRKVRTDTPSLPSVCLYTLTSAAHGLSAVSISHDENLLACGFEDSSIRLWAMSPKLLVSEQSPVNVSRIHLACDAENNVEANNKGSDMKVLRAHGGPVYDVDFVPNTEVLLSCSGDSTVRAWDLKSHTNVALYKGHAYPVFDLDVSPLGLYFATASHDNTARIWTLDRTYPLRILAGHHSDVDCVKFHPNCNYVATGSSDKSLRLWSIQDGRMVRLFQGHRGSIFAIAFSPSGQIMASAGEDRRIKIWDLSSGSSIKELRGQTDAVYSLSFNGDGSVLASSGLEHSIRLWDIRKGTSGATLNEANLDSRTSPELLTAFPTKQTSIPFVKYTCHSLLTAVGVTAS